MPKPRFKRLKDDNIFLRAAVGRPLEEGEVIVLMYGSPPRSDVVGVFTSYETLINYADNCNHLSLDQDRAVGLHIRKLDNLGPIRL